MKNKQPIRAHAEKNRHVPTGADRCRQGSTSIDPIENRESKIENSSTRWKCTCAYDGAVFDGWQSQASGRGIQDIIEARLREIFGTLIRIHASGRTDAGVHARVQVFHFDAPWGHGHEKLRAALRFGLPRQIQIKTLRPAPPDFHARFSARGKRYTYHIHLGDADPFTRPYAWPIERPPLRPLDIAAMRAAAALLLGEHDFRAFTVFKGQPEKNTVRTLRRLDIASRGRRLRITVEAGGFLYKMVRCLVGALVAVGDGKLTRKEVRAMLRTGRRAKPVQVAPPQGLFLDKVFY